MQRSCRQCQSAFEVTDDDLKFLQDVSPVIAGVRYDIPPPTLCPDCRAQRRYAVRNERTLYKRTCAKTNVPILSVFSSDKPFIPYKPEAWYSDDWDAKAYGRPFDFGRPFFPQFRELMEAVPQLALSVVNNQNSDYINQAGWCKNCYLIFEADYAENCYYSNNINTSRSCMEILQGMDLELCYECVFCRKSYNLRHSRQCENCSDSWFLRDCIGCKDCVGCANLRNKRFCILNKEYSEDEYRTMVAGLALHTRAGIERFAQTFAAFERGLPVRAYYGVQNEDSVGNYLWNTQRCHGCFEVQSMQDCKHVVNSRNMKNAQDITVFGALEGAEVCYECHEIGGGVTRCAFSDQLWTAVTGVHYSKLCLQNCHDLFGCIGLRHASFCVFNTQYTQGEYEELVPKIIAHMRETGEWGEFFPIDISPFAYNETIAPEHFPLEKPEALSRGWAWHDMQDETPKVERVVDGAQLPDSIETVGDEILQWAVRCAASGRLFRIVKQELDFYRTHRLPVPTVHPDERHRRRLQNRNPRKLWARPCMQCGKEMQTTYAPDRPEIVYCEECYLKEVY